MIGKEGMVMPLRAQRCYFEGRSDALRAQRLYFENIEGSPSGSGGDTDQ
jgi:hypothetical protein